MTTLTSEYSEIEKKTGYFKAIDGTPIYYEVRGQGEPLVFIYGIACLMNHWHNQVEFFSKTHQVILFDIRGHHKSVPVNNINNFTFEHLAFDVKYLLKHLNLKNAHFVGHSFGAACLLKTYEQFPEIFRSMTFVNGFARNPLKKLYGFEFAEPLFNFIRTQHQKYPDLWNNLWRGLVDNPLAFQLAALGGGFNIKLTQMKDIEMYARGVSRLELPYFFELFDQMLKFDGTSVLAKIDCPTFIIAGDRDILTPTSFQRELHDSISKSEFLLIPYGSHCCQLDFPDYLNLRLLEFLKKIIS